MSNYIETVTKEPTCTEEGEKILTCVCGDTKTERIPATGHNYIDDICTECGKEYTLEPGLYNADDVLLASWDELVNDYGLDISKNYTSSNCKSNVSSIYYICNNNAKLRAGQKLVIGDNVTKIGDYAFGEGTRFTYIKLPNSLTSIGKWAFYNCKNLMNIKIPNSVITISERAFQYCTSITDIEIPDGMKSIEAGTFYGCTSLKSVAIPNSVTSIGFVAFSDCTSLQNIEIPDGVTSISGGLFTNCTSLTSIEIPDSVTSINTAAFMNTGLSTIYIPSNVTTILGEAKIYNKTVTLSMPFYECSSDLQIYCGAGSKQSGWSSHWNAYDATWSDNGAGPFGLKPLYLNVNYNITREEYEASYKQ